MTDTSNNKKLTLGKLRQLVQAAGNAPADQSVGIDAELFDWEKPHHFCPDNLAMFEAFGKKLEKQIAKTFENLCQNHFDVHVTSIDQHFAYTLEANIRTENPNHYFLPFDIADGTQGGFMTISPETSIAMVGLMLRDTTSADGEQRQLSDLEDTILMDLSSAILNAFGFVLTHASGPSIKREPRFVKGDWPLVFSGLEDFFSITLTITDEQNSIELIFTIKAAAMEPVLGVHHKSESSIPESQIRKTIMENIQEANIEVQAQLVKTRIPLNDIMNLAPGDTVVLPKKTYEPLDVLLNKRPCFKAFPAKSRGKIALVFAPHITDKI